MVTSQHKYPRDMIGYGGKLPEIKFPGNARIAVQFVLNYEEGGENSILHGDGASETFLSEIISASAYEDRHMSMESLYEYGSRAGFWRVHNYFVEQNIPLTIFGVGMALERNPEAVRAMLNANWEIACHGYRWIDHQFMPREVEGNQIAKAMETHLAVTGSLPVGWYTGRDSPNTRSLVLEHENILYDSDSYADDLPYWVKGPRAPHLIIPYTLDTNDMRFATAQGFNSGEQFFQYIKDAFDILYEEGEKTPKLLNIGLHSRIIGRPARFKALKKFVSYIKSKSNVWICKREDIAHHWYENHQP